MYITFVCDILSSVLFILLRYIAEVVVLMLMILRCFNEEFCNDRNTFLIKWRNFVSVRLISSPSSTLSLYVPNVFNEVIFLTKILKKDYWIEETINFA